MSEESIVAEEYEVLVTGQGVSVKKTVDPTRARLILDIVMGGANIAFGSPSSSKGAPNSSPGVRLSLREYLDEVGAKSKPEQMVAIGNYLRLYEDVPDFDREMIRSRFSEAREPLPTNFPRDWHAAERHGWIAKAPGNAGRHYVTKKGADYLHAKLGNKGDQG